MKYLILLLILFGCSNPRNDYKFHNIFTDCLFDTFDKIDKGQIKKPDFIAIVCNQQATARYTCQDVIASYFDKLVLTCITDKYNEN